MNSIVILTSTTLIPDYSFSFLSGYLPLYSVNVISYIYLYSFLLSFIQFDIYHILFISLWICLPPFVVFCTYHTWGLFTSLHILWDLSTYLLYVCLLPFLFSLQSQEITGNSHPSTSSMPIHFHTINTWLFRDQFPFLSQMTVILFTSNLG